MARLTDVSLPYGKTHALDAITLDLPAGCMVGLIGPDGVGKSSLLALIAGARRIQQGRVEVLGGDMADAGFRRDACPRIAYMPQGLGKNLYPTLSVFENADFFARLFGLGRAERQAPHRRAAGQHRAGALPRPAGRQAVRRHEAEALPVLRADPRPGPADPRRADHRRRSAVAPPVLGAGRSHPGRPAGHERPGGDRLHGGGRPVRLAGGDGRRPGARHRHAGGAAGADRGPGPGRGLHRPAAGGEAPAATRSWSSPRARRASDEVVIEAHGLTQRFGDFVAVDHVSFRIERGEIFGFLGANGCGKSTTMKMLCGLLPPTEGQAWLFGEPVDANDIDIRRKVGYMSQAFSLYSELTVRQNLVLHAQLFRRARSARSRSASKRRPRGSASTRSWTRCPTRSRWGNGSACSSPWR